MQCPTCSTISPPRIAIGSTLNGIAATRNGARRHHAPVPSRRSASRPRAGWHRARRSSARSLSSAPILLGFALHGRRIGVFHLEPIGRAAGPIGRVFPLRHDRIRVRGSGGRYTDGPRDLETRLLVRLWRQNCSRSWESIATWPGIVKSFQRDLPSILAHPLGLCLGVFYNGRRQL